MLSELIGLRRRSRQAGTAKAGAAELGTDSPLVPKLGAATDDTADVHGSLSPLSEAARLTRARVTVLPVPLAWKPKAWLPGRLQVLVQIAAFARAHVRLAFDLWRLRRNDLVLVREFLTPFTLLVWPLIWPLRRRSYLLNNHNLQAALRGGLEGLCLKLLLRAGLRLALLDTAAGVDKLGIPIPPSHVLVLPHPSSIVLPRAETHNQAASPVVGVVGAMRREKNSEALLEELWRLREEHGLSARLLLGCPEAGVREQWRARGFEVVDTTRREDYADALRQCGVLVLNYRSDRYRYRASGVIADALNQRTVVVCPDFPVMRSQLTWPVRVGWMYEGFEELQVAIEKALGLRAGLDGALVTYDAERGVEATARLMDKFVSEVLSRETSGPPVSD